MSEYLHNSDEDLLRMVQGGDSSAFTELVERHTDKFFGVAWKTWPNREDAEEVVQEAFVKLWQDPFLYDPDKGAKFTTWFYRVVTNLALDRARKKKPVNLDQEVLACFADKETKTPAENHRNLEEKLALEGAIYQLPERQKMALNLCFYEGMSNKEAAEVMEVGVKALESLLMRAKAGVKHILISKGVISEEEVA